MEIFDCCLININKPCGPTSHQVSAWISKIFNRKAGHSGTLDPKVIGVLPIGIGKGTVFLHLLLKFPKEYVGIMKLHKSVEKSKLEKEDFEGCGRCNSKCMLRKDRLELILSRLDHRIPRFDNVAELVCAMAG